MRLPVRRQGWRSGWHVDPLFVAGHSQAKTYLSERYLLRLHTFDCPEDGGVCARIFQDRSCVLDASDGNKTQVEKTLDIDYKTLLAKLKKYGLVQ